VFLSIEVADSSLPGDLGEKPVLRAESGMAGYWVVDVCGKCIHVFVSVAVHGPRRSDTIRLPSARAAIVLGSADNGD
jgi:hypothetical protein